ncbi:MAG: hypothetical protein ACJ79K_04090 [Gemmatimonadaceae bacterium]
MTRLTKFALVVLALAVVGASPRHTQAQAPAPAPAPCSYERCALDIVPTWNGLAVERGTAGPRMALLNFFWPRDVSVAFVGDDARAIGIDSAIAAAHRAVRVRRTAAFFTDAGLLLGGVALGRSLGAGKLRRGEAILAGAGGVALVVSIPLQFAADGALSRAVWWHNRRFAR